MDKFYCQHCSGFMRVDTNLSSEFITWYRCCVCNRLYFGEKTKEKP
jgi:hypothetical protein